VDKQSIKGKKVIVVEDGPTLTHGEMAYGAGAIFAKKEGAKMIRPAKDAVGSIRKVYEKFPHLKNILPAMGYGAKQIREFEATINKAKADIVLGATPVDLSKLIKINKPMVQVRYALKAPPAFKQLLADFAKQAKTVKKKNK
jgi:predicted GTPase